MEPKDIQNIIEAALPDAIVRVKGDGQHFEAVVVSGEFEGKGLLEQHKLLYSVLGDNMEEKIHAISFKTFTPPEWERKQGG